MVVSNHSHSGQFCGHATDTLEEVIQEAISQKFKVFSLTEHMPRDAEADLYPEEVGFFIISSIKCAMQLGNEFFD